jgi:acyl-CoA thioester hydrolase
VNKVSRTDSKIPSGAKVTSIIHKVAFYETDAMAVVHHANYVYFLEDARTAWFEEHDRCYLQYFGAGRHFAVVRVEVEYLRPTRYYDPLNITAALLWVRAASGCFVYDIRRDGELMATATTEHALVDDQGRLRRIPPEWRENLVSLAIQSKS